MLKRNIKFAIVLSNGMQIRTLEELIENFEVDTIVGYYLDGRLKTWLMQRFYTSQLQLLQNINEHNDSLHLEIAKVFGVNIEDVSFNSRQYFEKRSKLEVINKYTTDQVILENYEYVAVSQSELDTLLEKMTNSNNSIVYLLDDASTIFNISHNISNIIYIGVNNPTVILKESYSFDAKGNNIVFQNVKLIPDKESTIMALIASFGEIEEITISDEVKELLYLSTTVRLTADQVETVFKELNRKWLYSSGEPEYVTMLQDRGYYVHHRDMLKGKSYIS
ncbi:hypothetical protein [Paenibacillus sp. 2TAB19]|uniref:hypothetical protein n=1 Tax=Paenibacillus sp. 2TAB19 TaxID=3233003 RepID=UPI003F97DCAD